MVLNRTERVAIKTYFYGSNGPLITAFIGVPLLFVFGIGLLFWTIALIWYLIEKYALDEDAEKLIDKFMNTDLNVFEERALRRLGLKREQVNIADPLKVIGPLKDQHSYTINNDILVRKRREGSILWPLYLFIHIIYWGFVILLNRDIHLSRLIYKTGSDQKTRYSLAKASVFLFNEKQIYVYQVLYDFCTGELFNESTYELFYHDIDCVITGEEYIKILQKKRFVPIFFYKKSSFEYFNVISNSGENISAYIDSPVSILDLYVKGMRTLIRSKKEE